MLLTAVTITALGVIALSFAVLWSLAIVVMDLRDAREARDNALKIVRYQSEVIARITAGAMQPKEGQDYAE
jgi:hypothetical protein